MPLVQIITVGGRDDISISRLIPTCLTKSSKIVQISNGKVNRNYSSATASRGLGILWLQYSKILGMGL